MKFSKRHSILLFFLAITYLFSFCSSNNENVNELEEQVTIIPSNLVYNIEIDGATLDNPLGNLNGKIRITASAENTVKYLFRLGDGNELENSTGIVDYTFTKPGRNIYFIQIIAFSETNDFISELVEKEIGVAAENTGPTNLIWSDEFNDDGEPNPNNWTYDIGRGNNGWGNGESQFYTKRSENVYVSDGTLKIIAQKENYAGAAYTSSRLLTQGLFNFTYGKVEIRAKLPSGGGTWPALWMLGSNFPTVGWPDCGEIDIMEHIGNDMGKIQSALHTPSSFGNTSNFGSTNIPNVDTEYHVYSANWTPEKIDFAVDNIIYYTYNPSTKNSSTWPFNNSQFLILNIAVGGSLGGNIDPNFQSSTMEIDYVRVFK